MLITHLQHLLLLNSSRAKSGFVEVKSLRSTRLSNCHIAFNDPPADFETKEPFIIVNLDQACKEQQVGEGWFSSIDVVPPQAITMSVHQILQCRFIVSPVPFLVKAESIKNVLESEKITNEIPATILRSHPNITLYLDQDSASLIKEKVL